MSEKKLLRNSLYRVDKQLNDFYFTDLFPSFISPSCRATGPGILGYTLSETVLNPEDGSIYRVYLPDEGTILPRILEIFSPIPMRIEFPWAAEEKSMAAASWTQRHQSPLLHLESTASLDPSQLVQAAARRVSQVLVMGCLKTVYRESEYRYIGVSACLTLYQLEPQVKSIYSTS